MDTLRRIILSYAQEKKISSFFYHRYRLILNPSSADRCTFQSMEEQYDLLNFSRNFNNFQIICKFDEKIFSIKKKKFESMFLFYFLISDNVSDLCFEMNTWQFNNNEVGHILMHVQKEFCFRFNLIIKFDNE